MTKNYRLATAASILFILGIVPAPVPAVQPNEPSAQPNLVFILTDDHRWDGVTSAGNELLQTPNLDRVAAWGTRFSNAFVTLAICSPSRAACLTGRYGSANGVTTVGRVLDELDHQDIRDNTWIIFMGDNGWLLGEHGMTSKVLPYEESMRIPMAITGPSTRPQVSSDLVLNIDLTATIYELAGLAVPAFLHGRSLLPIVSGQTPEDWRTGFLYEAPTPQLGSKPLWAVRTERWKYIETRVDADESSEDRYDLEADAIEQSNLANSPGFAERVAELRSQLRQHEQAIATQLVNEAGDNDAAVPDSADPDEVRSPRTDLMISGVYPHLTTYGVYSQQGAHNKQGHNECGIGAIVPWIGKLWMVNYAPHMPKGSEHKLYSVDADLTKPLTIHPESVGGTPAGRMIHHESRQLLIGHHLIDDEGNVRTIPPLEMPIRVTAMARHLTDPANLVYYVGMEGSVWEANVHTLTIKRLFKKPVPGWHGKGAYTSQGRLVVANNGELHVGDYRDVLVGGAAADEEERGVLAEFDGRNWNIVERRQYTEVTGPPGIAGGSDGDDPIWTMGWDRRSVRLKVLDQGVWHTYLLPKAAYCNDASHGWYTEWPRIREITGGRWMMDMHGMFYDFPATFSANNSAGIKPIGSHLRYVPDFCGWNGRLVLATDETSIQGNELAGQPQSNLWFGDYEDLSDWGPASGYGGPWIDDQVSANSPSDPYLVAGFDRRVIHLAVGPARPRAATNAAEPKEEQPVVFQLEVDRNGDGVWTELESLAVHSQGYLLHYLPPDLDAQWIRFRTDRDCSATVLLHQTASSYQDGSSETNQTLFAGLADVDDDAVHGAVVYAAQRNRNLRLITANRRFFEFSKSEFEFQPDKPDAELERLLKTEPEFTVDAASVMIKWNDRTLRLPKGHAAYDEPFSSGWPRGAREVESERELANIHGTFYELPLVTNQAPPAWNLVRPVCSHSKQVTDFCSWNGLLVLAGVRAGAIPDGHVFTDRGGSVALWFGGIDDLWKLGKPVGNGGPWANTAVVAGEPSDPYLIKGYDRKQVQLSQRSEQPVTLTLQVDLDGSGRWFDYRAFPVPPDGEVTHGFPDAFSACWIRVVSDQDCTATAQFEYR